MSAGRRGEGREGGEVDLSFDHTTASPSSCRLRLRDDECRWGRTTAATSVSPAMDSHHLPWLWLDDSGAPPQRHPSAAANIGLFPAHILRLLLQLHQGYRSWDRHVCFDMDDEEGLYHRVRLGLTGFESSKNPSGTPFSSTTATEMGSPANELGEQEFLDGVSCITAGNGASTAPRVLTVL